jgi:hypothetical protein
VKCRVSSVFTWTKFADRSLTLPELLWAWDFSQTEVSFWSATMETHPINNSLPFVGCPPSKVLLAWGNLLLGPMGWNLRKAEAQTSSLTTPRVKGVSDREKKLNSPQKEISGQPPPAKRLKADKFDSPQGPPPPELPSEPPSKMPSCEDKEAKNKNDIFVAKAPL